jgi:adenylate cyclase class IV
MQQEIEAKFLDQNHSEIRKKLKNLGAVCEYPETLVRRTVLDFPDGRLQSKRAWVRLREELDGSIELMVKQVKDDTLGQTFEQPVTVGDYESAKKFLLSLGLEIKAEQESKREVWRLGSIEIMLDTWPWVKPFIEIEAPSEAEVKNFASKMGLDWNEAAFGGVTPVYVAEFDLTNEEFESIKVPIKFDLPVPNEYKPK